MALTEAPTKPPRLNKDNAKSPEQKILDVINKGGKPSKQLDPDDKGYKNFNIHIYNEEMDDINTLRGLRPKPRRGKRLGISIHDWIIEAIQEKIEREKRKQKTLSY